MKLLNAARYFDDIDLTDPYTGLPLGIKAQFSTFDEADPDGSVSKRRSMSLAPGIALPARRAVRVLGEDWITGDVNQDGIFNKSIRQTVPMRRVTDSFIISTPAQAIGVSGSSPVLGRREYLKDTVDGTTTSEYFPFYNLYFATPEAAPLPGSFFKGSDSRLYRARSSYVTKDGFTCLECDLIDKSAITYAEFGSQVYDPVADSYGAGFTQFPVLVMLPHQLYNKKSVADHSYLPGDLTVLVRMADVVPTVGQSLNIDLGDLEWLDPQWWVGVSPGIILNVGTENDAYNLHIRKA